LKSCFEVECAVWHPTIKANAIEKSVGLSPRIGWSSGDPDRNTGATQDRTYCRFKLGTYSQEQISAGLEMLERFKALAGDPAFKEGPGIIGVYFKNINDSAELHLNLQNLRTLTMLGASVVFR
jgi:hypothetical protein